MYELLTPTEELMLEVLAGRWRLGEQMWTFSSRMKRCANSLADRGLVGWKGGIVEKTILVWLTDSGRAACLSPDYVPPIKRGINE
jgi:hypothetical protein